MTLAFRQARQVHDLPREGGASEHRTSSLDDANQYNHDSDYQKKMDPAPERVRTYQAEQPQHDENDRDCPEHRRVLHKRLITARVALLPDELARAGPSWTC